jgi:virginiamycin B lyase
MILVVTAFFAALGLLPPTSAASFVRSEPDASRWKQYPGSDFGCNQLAAGPSGDVWFCDTRGKAIDSMSSTGVVTSYPGLQNHEPCCGLAVGPDGNIWYGANGGGLVRMTPLGSLTFFRMPKGEYALYITAGPDGNIWTAGYNVGIGSYHLSKITMTGEVTLYPPQPGNAGIKAIIAGPDGNIWYNDFESPGGSIIGRVTPDGVFTQFKTPRIGEDRLVPAKDGNLYSATGVDFVLAKITTRGRISYIKGTQNMVDGPYNLTEGPDGNVWGNIECFQSYECLFRYDVVSGSFFMTKIPRPALAIANTLLIAGPDGNIWIQPYHCHCGPNMIFEYLTGLR